MWLRTCKDCHGDGEVVLFTFANPMEEVVNIPPATCSTCDGTGYEEYTDAEVKELGVEDGADEWYYVPF